MSLSTIDELHYLWDGSEPSWVLVHLNSDRPSEEPRYSIFNVQTRMGLLIEDPSEAAEAKRRMLAAGIRVVKSLTEL